MLFLAQHGYRAIAHDRRGHGRSNQSSSYNDMNGYADDLDAVLDALDLRDAVLVRHSTGGGEVVRYLSRHGSKRIAKVVLIAAVPPIMLKTETNPEGLPMDVFDSLRSSLTKDRSQFYKDFAIPFYGANRPGAKVSQSLPSVVSFEIDSCQVREPIPEAKYRTSPNAINQLDGCPQATGNRPI